MNTTSTQKKTIEGLMLEKEVLTQEQLDKARNIQTQTLERLEDIVGESGVALTGSTAVARLPDPGF